MDRALPTKDRAVAQPAERRAAIITACFGITIAVFALGFGGDGAAFSSAVPSALISAAVVTMIVTAAILRYFYQASNFPPHAILGIGFACTGGLLVPYIFATIEVASTSQSEAASQFAAWLWIAWHAIFVLMIGAYVCAEAYFTRRKLTADREHKLVRGFGIAAACLATGVVIFLLMAAQSLPVLQTNAGTFTPAYHNLTEQLLLALCAAVCAFLTLKTGLNKTVHLWLGVVLVLFACEVFVDGQVAHQAFSVSWYVGLAEGLGWQSVLLIVLLRRAHEQFAQFVVNNRTLTHETLNDPLTKLLNRRGFDERFQEALAEAHLAHAPLAILALDLDNFKAYNDHYGHVAGDDALRAIGLAIASVTTRPRDTASRIGGEEFAVILPGTDEAGALTVAERIRSAVLQLRLKHAPSAANHLLSISIGVGLSDGTLDGTRLRERADQALYRAKALGRNRISRYRADDEFARLQAV
jgi:diguanylate cyclase (GGDEF)-like protein